MVWNQIKTVLLLGALTGIVLLIGGYVGGTGGLTVAFIIALGMNAVSYFWSHKFVLMMYGAKEAAKKDYPQLHKIVEEVSRAAGIPKPKVYIIQLATPNAFATGRNPSNAVVAATTGILELLSNDELKGVIGHEIGHVKNRDILICTIAATLATVISYVAQMLQFSAIFGGGRDDRNGGNFFGMLAIAILAPIMALLIQLAISRSREYLADETGAKLTRNPLWLASALRKLETGVKHHPMRIGNSATSSLFIVNPFSANALVSLLSTHPPTAERVKRLEVMND